jgi:hypothetical protein
VKNGKLKQLTEDINHRPMGSVHSSLWGIAESRRKARTKSKKKPSWFSIKHRTVNLAAREMSYKPHVIRYWDGALFTHEIAKLRALPTVFACQQEAEAFINKNAHLNQRPFGYAVPLSSIL